MGVYLWNRLPSEYQEVEYIQSSGTQYIILGNQFKTSYKVVIDLQMTVIGGDYIPVGVHNNDGVNNIKYGIDAYSSMFHLNAGGAWTATITEDTNRHTIIIDKSTANIDGTDYTIPYTNYTFNDGIGVFCYYEIHQASKYNFKSSNKLYKLDIYDENGNHIHEAIPCYRKSDNVIGLYDLVNNQFYTNSGTGTFTKGQDTNNVEHELKNAYIGIPYPESISLDKNSISLTTIGQTAQLTATITPTPSDKTITWTSSDNTIATVSSSGLVTCVTPGECTITATTVNGLTATCSVAQGLPSTYQEVEYIQSSGGQYINTAYVPTTSTKIEIDMEFVGGDSNSWIPLYGRRGATNTTYFCLYVNSSSLYMTPNYAGFDPGTSSGLTISTNTKYNIINDAGQFYLDGVLKTSASTTNTLANSTYPIFLFDNNIQGSPQGRNTQMKLYSCKMYEGNTLGLDLVPCYRIADTVIGMYDLVNGVFYTNSGSGTFTKGADV